jgi:phosphate transport system substrate-binding protein
MLRLQRIITQKHIYIATFVCLIIILCSLWSQIILPQHFYEVNNLPSGTFKYGGSTSWSTIPAKVEDDIKKISQSKGQNFKLKKYNSIGSDKGIHQLLENKLDFSLSSRELKDDERKKGLKQIPVAIDGIAIVVNSKLDIDELNLDQLKAIYKGEIINWKEIDSKMDLPIKPLSRKQEDSGTVEFFIKEVLKGEKIPPEFQNVNTTSDALIKLEKDPLYKGGIYFATASEVVTKCNVKPLGLRGKSGALVKPNVKPTVPKPECPSEYTGVNTAVFKSGEYPITRKFFVIINTKQPNEDKQQAGKAYARFLLTNEGQELLEKANFVRMK